MWLNDCEKRPVLALNENCQNDCLKSFSQVILLTSFQKNAEKTLLEVVLLEYL